MARRRRSLLTPLLLVLAAAAVTVAVILVGPSSSGGTVGRQVATVSRGVVQQTVSGSGNLAPVKQVDVDFATSGTVTHVYVTAGQHVVTGQLLATLDPGSARVALAQAKADLASAQDDLSKATDASSTTSGAAYHGGATTVAIADPAPGTTTTTTTPSTTTPATTTPKTTTTPAKEKQTKEKKEKTTTPSSGGSGSSGTGTSAGGSPTGATSSRPASAASGGTASSGGAASSGGSSSAGSSAMSVASAQAEVDSARLSVRTAKKALAATRLHAPMAGTIAAVSGAVGDTEGSASSSSASSSGSGQASGTGSSAGSGSSSSSSGSGFITLADLHRMSIQVSLSESDVGKVKVGQAATVTVNAASGAELAGRVSDVGVLASSSSSSSSTGSTSDSTAVSYPVTIRLDQSAKGIKAGMSASADIVTGQASGLTVPSQAVQGSSVTLVQGNRDTTQRVTTGLEGDTSTQIVSGLKAGDRVVVTSTSALAGQNATSTSTAQSASGSGGFGARARAGGLGGGNFGGGGGGPPGGFGGGAP